MRSQEQVAGGGGGRQVWLQARPPLLSTEVAPIFTHKHEQALGCRRDAARTSTIACSGVSQRCSGVVKQGLNTQRDANNNGPFGHLKMPCVAAAQRSRRTAVMYPGVCPLIGYIVQSSHQTTATHIYVKAGQSRSAGPGLLLQVSAKWAPACTTGHIQNAL